MTTPTSPKPVVLITGALTGIGRATALAVFLASPGASFMTGAIDPVDGGMAAL